MMRLAISFAFIVLLVSVGRVAAQNLSNLDGTWICQSGCGCSPASPHRYASISAAHGSARNECGQETALTGSGGRIQAIGWGVGATVSADGISINWDNGSVWTRLSPNASELEIRMAYWESRAFYCPSPAAAFPSKEAESGAPSCDDGDSVMFNALLCRAGDPRGCNAIGLSQDDTGRFWRSPEKRRTHPVEAVGLKSGETTFSGDHAAGLFLYFGFKGDPNAFRRWVHWIDSNERCLTFCGPMPVGTPRYCKNDRCVFRIGDCQTLLLLASRLNVALPFCLDSPAGTIPTVANMAHAMRNAYDQTVGKFPVQPPELKALRDNFEKALKAYEDAIEPIDLLRTKLAAEVVQRQNLPQIEKALSGQFNDRGFPRHNALLQIMMLQDWGSGTNWMSSVAKSAVESEPLNPFFQYVAHRRSNKDSMLPLILAECPSAAMDLIHPHLRRQWSWERDTAKKEWTDTMYWDCMFIAAMYTANDTTPPDDNSTEESLRSELKKALEDFSDKLGKAQHLLKQIIALMDPTNPVIESFRNELEHPDPLGRTEQILNQLRDLPHPGKVIDDLGWHL